MVAAYLIQSKHNMPFSLFSTAWIFDWAQSPTWQLTLLLLLNVLWIPMLWWLWKEIRSAFQEYVVEHFDKTREFVLLAIDVPRDTEQTPVGMEAIFNQLEGAHGTLTKWEEIWEGKFQEWFSFEIVSIDGYVQYMIRCQKDLRDIVEASVYAQYPDAEITEVRDYVNDVPHLYPDDDWDMFGTEYNLAKPSAYPIRVYREFEDKVRGEFLDPMSGLLEIMSKIGKGEQIWYQVLAQPIVDPDWAPEAQKVIDKIVDRQGGDDDGGSIFSRIAGLPVSLVDRITSVVFPDLGGGGDDRKGDKPRTNVLTATPGEAELVKEMERKLTKLAYKCRIRIVYIAKKNVYSKARGVGPVIGAVKQFNDGTKNFFKVGKKTWTKANYAFKKARVALRQTKFIKAYASRSIGAGEAIKGYVLNTEELATIYHFPMASVKAPLLKRTGARKSEPPATLPIDLGDTTVISVPDRPEPPVSADIDVEKEPAQADQAAKTNEVAVPTGDSGVTFVDIPDEQPDVKPNEPPANLPMA